jgi:hypothetical protein
MRYFLVEIPVLIPDRFEMERATRTLNAAQFRLSGSTMAAGPLIAAVLRDSGRLVCLIEAPSIPDLRRLIALALLPAGRIREISHPVSRSDAGTHWEPVSDPTADLGP